MLQGGTDDLGAAGLEFWPIWLGAALGAAAGDVLSYEFGRRFKQTAYGIAQVKKMI